MLTCIKLKDTIEDRIVYTFAKVSTAQRNKKIKSSAIQSTVFWTVVNS